MKAATFTHRRLVALAVCFTFSVLMATSATKASGGSTSGSADNVQDESSRIHINPRVAKDLEDFSNDLITYVKVYNDLGEKQRITQAEVNSLMKLEGEAKRMAPMYKAAVSSAISELQGAGLWNDALDMHVTKLLKGSSLDAGKKATALSLLQQAGGYRSLMARTRDLMDRVPGMFSDAMNDLKKKVASSAVSDSGLIRAAYVPARDLSRVTEVALVKKTKLTLCEICSTNLISCQLACRGKGQANDGSACLFNCSNRLSACFAANGGCAEITQ